MTQPFMSPLETATNLWEHMRLHSHDKRPIGVAEASGILRYVLPLYGVREIPAVQHTAPGHPDHIRGAVASCDPHTGIISVHQPGNFSTTVLLHEAAHLLVEDPLDVYELRPLRERTVHGRLFYACLFSLLDQTMGRQMPVFSKAMLMGSFAAQVPEMGPLDWFPTVRGVPKPGL